MLHAIIYYGLISGYHIASLLDISIHHNHIVSTFTLPETCSPLKIGCLEGTDRLPSLGPLVAYCIFRGVNSVSFREFLPGFYAFNGIPWPWKLPASRSLRPQRSCRCWACGAAAVVLPWHVMLWACALAAGGWRGFVGWFLLGYFLKKIL